MAVLLIAGAGSCLSHAPVAAAAATTPVTGAEPSGRPAGGFDPAVLQAELSHPVAALQAQPTEALRAHVQRLGDLQFAMELAADVPPEERRLLNDRILARVAQVGRLLRQRTAEGRDPGKGRGIAEAVGAWFPAAGDLPGILMENSGLLVRLFGGLLIAYALGSLAASRRAARSGSSSGRGGSPTDWMGPAPDRPGWPEEEPTIAVTEIREALAAGHTVLLEMGSDIAPSNRNRFLELTRQMREILDGVEGQTYTVWEDPAHPNRFYELLVCRQVGILDLLTATEGPLPRLAGEIEVCRVPGGFVLQRVWWDTLPQQQWAADFAPVPEASVAR